MFLHDFIAMEGQYLPKLPTHDRYIMFQTLLYKPLKTKTTINHCTSTREFKRFLMELRSGKFAGQGPLKQVLILLAVGLGLKPMKLASRRKH